MQCIHCVRTMHLRLAAVCLSQNSAVALKQAGGLDPGLMNQVGCLHQIEYIVNMYPGDLPGCQPGRQDPLDARFTLVLDIDSPQNPQTVCVVNCPLWQSACKQAMQKDRMLHCRSPKQTHDAQHL